MPSFDRQFRDAHKALSLIGFDNRSRRWTREQLHAKQLDLLHRYDALPWWRRIFKPRDFKQDVREVNIQIEAIRLNKILTDLAWIQGLREVLAHARRGAR